MLQGAERSPKCLKAGVEAQYDETNGKILILFLFDLFYSNYIGSCLMIRILSHYDEKTRLGCRRGAVRPGWLAYL